MCSQSPTMEAPAPHPAAPRRRQGVSPGWTIGIFFSSLTLVVCVIVAAAWGLGGRVVHTPPTVQELLPPEPRQHAGSEAGGEATMASGLQPPAGAGEEYSINGAAAVLPGASEISEVQEIPIENIGALKSMGWAVPYLSRSGYEHQYAETTSLDGVRTIQARLSDGDYYVNVAETRAEEADVGLEPLSENLHSVVDQQRVMTESMELGSGQEADLYQATDGSSWTAAVESTAVHYVITSDLPVEAAAEISSWVLITDRSRIQVLPSSPGAGDRLERGFEELFGLFDR